MYRGHAVQYNLWHDILRISLSLFPSLLLCLGSRRYKKAVDWDRVDISRQSPTNMNRVTLVGYLTH